MMNEFNATTEVEKLRKENAKRIEARRGKKFGRCASKLDRFKSRLLSMYSAGATLTLLQLWLRKNKVNVQLTTISRWIKKNNS